MKNQLYILTITLLMALLSGSLAAQSAGEFDRDIRIAEGIIEELFEADNSSSHFGNRHIRDVSGRYIPGYGIHFRIGANLTPSIVRVVLEGQTEIHIDEDSEPEELIELGREFVEQRFLEYLKNYASLFRDLPNDEVIRLTIGPHNFAAGAFIVRSGRSDSRRTVANITAWAKSSDIQAFDNRSISEQEFESRVEVIDLGEHETERDQTVFASILQTSLEGVSDTIHVRREPTVEYLPGLGLSFQVNASLTNGNWFDFGDIEIEELRIELDSLSVNFSNMFEDIDFDEIGRMAEHMDSAFAPNVPRINADSMRRSFHEMRESVAHQREREQLSDEAIRKLVDQFHAALTQTVHDYGSTLRSLGNDEMLMITVNWNGRHSALPERSELRIQKSDILNGRDPILEEVQRR